MILRYNYLCYRTLFKIVNTLHPTIKFTMNHKTSINDKEKCECKDNKLIPFLDTSLSIEECQIVVHLYKKLTDKKTIFVTIKLPFPRNHKVHTI